MTEQSPNEMEIKCTELFYLTRDVQAKTLVHVGGAGSSKSHSIAQYLVSVLVSCEGKHIAIMRKTFPSLRITAMALMLDLLVDYGIYDENNHNKTAATYTHRIGKGKKPNVVYFMSLDDPEKIKSANLSIAWLEEANEFTWEDYNIIKLRLRRPVTDDVQNKMILSLNPSDATGWIPEKLCGVKTGDLR